MEQLGLAAFGFRPYSLRRGGATAFYRATRNMAVTIERGRWSTISVARIYINDGLAKEVDINMSRGLSAPLQARASALAASLQGGLLGTTPPAIIFGGRIPPVGSLFTFVCFPRASWQFAGTDRLVPRDCPSEPWEALGRVRLSQLSASGRQSELGLRHRPSISH